MTNWLYKIPYDRQKINKKIAFIEIIKIPENYIIMKMNYDMTFTYM